MATMSPRLAPLHEPFVTPRTPVPAPGAYAAESALEELFPDLRAAADAALAELFPALRLRRHARSG